MYSSFTNNKIGEDHEELDEKHETNIDYTKPTSGKCSLV